MVLMMNKWDRLRIQSINIVTQINIVTRLGKLMVSVGTQCFRKVLIPATY